MPEYAVDTPIWSPPVTVLYGLALLILEVMSYYYTFLTFDPFVNFESCASCLFFYLFPLELFYWVVSMYFMEPCGEGEIVRL